MQVDHNTTTINCITFHAQQRTTNFKPPHRIKGKPTDDRVSEQVVTVGDSAMRPPHHSEGINVCVQWKVADQDHASHPRGSLEGGVVPPQAGEAPG